MTTTETTTAAATITENYGECQMCPFDEAADGTGLCVECLAELNARTAEFIAAQVDVCPWESEDTDFAWERQFDSVDEYEAAMANAV